MAACPSLDEISATKLNMPCKDLHFWIISEHMNKWESIAPHLGISETTEEDIYCENTSRCKQRIAMLREWRKANGRKATYKALATAFKKANREDLVDHICALLEDNNHNSDDEQSYVSRYLACTGIVEWCAYYLRSWYMNETPESFTFECPPSPIDSNKMFKLGMIHRESLQRGVIDENYLKMKQTGCVDEIMLENIPIQLDDIFQDHEGASKMGRAARKRKVVLIEGVPGSGKTAVSWYICQEWGSEKMFTEFDLVFFIQLGDPAVKQCSSISEILRVKYPHLADNDPDNLLPVLKRRFGRGVLYVLDGWDEFDEDSICGKLVCKPGDLSMQESYVVVTSRPNASHKLQKFCSRRIEIVGFNPREVEGYFNEALKARKVNHQAAMEECLRVRPVIKASCYLPVNAAFVAHLFLSEGNRLPTTLNSLFTDLIINCIIRHSQRVNQEVEICAITSLNEIPSDMQPQFSALSCVAFDGIMNEKASFSEDELRKHRLTVSKHDNTSLLSLLQGWCIFRKNSTETSYSFFHLPVQELMAAYYISKQSAREQVKICRQLFSHPRYSAVLQHYAAITKFHLKGMREFLKSILQCKSHPSFEQHADNTCGRPQITPQSLNNCVSLPKEAPCVHNRALVYKCILNCLYEAQDPKLCQDVATFMDGRLTVAYTLSPVHCTVLGYFLQSICLAGGTFHIDFDDCLLDEYRCDYFINELKKCKRGQLSLSLSGAGHAWPDVAFMLVSKLNENCSHCISEITFTTKSGEDSDASLLAQYLLANSHTKPLSFNFKHIAGTLDTTVKHLSNDLSRRSTTLKSLNLAGSSIPPESIRALAISIATNRSMETLDLSECNIPPEDIRRLAAALTVNKTLRTLVLSKNPLGDDGLKYIAQVLTDPDWNATLTTLHISECQIHGDAAGHLQTLLAGNKVLQTLVLSGNDLSTGPLGKRGADYLAKGLAENASLTSLDIACCRLSDHTLGIIVESLERNPTLFDLDCSGNHITDIGLNIISKRLRKVRTLKRINLGDVQNVWRNSYNNTISVCVVLLFILVAFVCVFLVW